MLTNEQIGKRIEDRRNELNLTMQALADMVCVDKSTVQRYEKGKIGKIKLPVIEAFAMALKVNPSWLIGKSPAKECILSTTAQSTPQSSTLTAEQAELLRKFDLLDARGKAAVWNVLNYEFEACTGERSVSAPKEA